MLKHRHTKRTLSNVNMRHFGPYKTSVNQEKGLAVDKANSEF
jgi:hypothetical protein